MYCGLLIGHIYYTLYIKYESKISKFKRLKFFLFYLLNFGKVNVNSSHEYSLHSFRI